MCLAIAAALMFALSACGGSQNAATLSPAAKVGALMFNDRNLSASGAQACSTCHNPNNADAQTNQLAVQLGGVNLNQLGFRTPPSLRYLSFTPAQGLDASGRPVGGFDRDGRAASLAEQAQGPILASFEMANPNEAAVVTAVQNASYADQFRLAFGSDVFSDVDTAFADITYALQQYQLEDAEFHPYDSQYDYYLKGQATLTDAQQRGLALFNDPTKGNCNACHTSQPGADGSPPQFTNFHYANLGIPRNPAIPANANVAYFDLGLCGPYRLDLANQPSLCGSFKVPTLRNVATRNVFFHNGVFKDLTQTVTFLIQRDTQANVWYPISVDGSVQKFNDLPLTMIGNVDTIDAPFNRSAGAAPALTSAEIADLVAFLGTLTDGYVVQQ